MQLINIPPDKTLKLLQIISVFGVITTINNIRRGNNNLFFLHHADVAFNKFFPFPYLNGPTFDLVSFVRRSGGWTNGCCGRKYTQIHKYKREATYKNNRKHITWQWIKYKRHRCANKMKIRKRRNEGRKERNLNFANVLHRKINIFCFLLEWKTNKNSRHLKPS